VALPDAASGAGAPGFIGKSHLSMGGTPMNLHRDVYTSTIWIAGYCRG